MEETPGQDVVLNILEVFVNRWRHVWANVTSLCPEIGEWKKKRVESNNLISNGTEDTEIDRKTGNESRFNFNVQLREWSRLCLFPDFYCNIQLPIVQNHKQVTDFRKYFLKHFLVTYVPPSPLLYLCLYHSFISLVRSCSYSWHQYGRAFFCLSPVLESYIHRANQFKR